MIKYLGSKRLLLPHITNIISNLDNVSSVVDLFSGTARVGHALKRAGLQVLANDHNAYAATLARCYVAADAENIGIVALKLLRELNALPGSAGYFTETFCIKSRFFTPQNGERIDTIREAIARKGLDPELEAVVLTSLMEAADRVDSTTGVQMAYLKTWAPRAQQRLELRLPDVLPRAAAGRSAAYELDAYDAAQRLSADCFYLDPPYNQHKYLGNYHIWESLVRWDKPEVYGVACKRVDCRARPSAFNSKPRSLAALRNVIFAAQCRFLVVSFNNEGFIGRDAMEALLGERGRVTVHEYDFKRYVGAQIGIFSPSGQKVGLPGHRRNTEFLYIVDAR